MTPVLRRLHEVAKAEDPGRATTLADLSLGGQGEGKIRVSGITDVWALNRYYLWYYGDALGLVRDLDGIHAKYPRQPVGVSEYGAGAALGDHTDNVLGGPPTPFGIPDGRAYQPEEYAAHVHERIYEVLASRPFVWGTYVWAMFDFGSGIRNEGDLRGVNTKGLVTFDRKTRKDPFYFYKANWSAEPVTHIVGRRYADRAYATTDVKVYSNADAVALLVNGAPAGTLTSCRVSLQDVRVPQRRPQAGQERRRRPRHRRGSGELRRGGVDVAQRHGREHRSRPDRHRPQDVRRQEVRVRQLLHRR